MKSSRFIFLLSSFFLLPTGNAVELNAPHKYGEMEMLVKWQAPNLEITLVASAKDLIGYERAPRSAKEKKALRKFDSKYDPLELINTNPTSNCEFMQSRSVSDMFSATTHKHGLLDKPHAHTSDLKGHITFMLHFKYECQTTPQFSIEIFSRAPSIKTVNVRSETIDGSIETTLTNKNKLYTAQ